MLQLRIRTSCFAVWSQISIPAMTATAIEPAACADFIGKWRAREPEMTFAEPFCPGPLRARFQLWGALLLELRESAFELSDALVMEAKSAWWAEELGRTAMHAARHPLTQALVHEAQMPLPWPQLGNGMLASAASEPRPADADAAIAGMRPLAEGIVAFEAALFPGESFAAGNEQALHVNVSNAVVVHLLVERLRMGLSSQDGGRIPMSLLARHRITAAQLVEPDGAAAIADWAQQLLAFAPARLRGASLYRRTHSAFDRRALQRHAQRRTAAPAPPLRALWLAWTAARQDSAAATRAYATPAG
jgi:hypothetical protein